MLVFDTKNQRSYRRVDKPAGKLVLDTLQSLVKGNIELLPHRKGWDARFTAYANEEGMLSDLPSNYLSWGVLRHLGFEDSTQGNVVLMGHNERALTVDAMALVDKALAAYKKEMEMDDDDDDDDEQNEKKAKKERDEQEYETPPKTKKRRVVTEKKDE